MPTIPIMGQDVAPSPLPNARFNPGTVTAADLGGGLVKTAGDIAADVYGKAAQKADELVVMDADLKAANLQTQLTLDPKDGFTQKRGQNAFGISADYNAKFSDGLKEIEQGLSTDEQKIAFRRTAMARQATFNNQITGHVAQQTESFDNSTTAAYVKAASDQLVSAAMMPATNAQERQARDREMEANQQRIIAGLTSHADRNGLSSVDLKEQVDRAMTQAHLGVISTFIDNDQAEEAQNYYDKHRDEIVGTGKGDAIKAIDSGRLAGQSTAKSDEIYAGTVKKNTNDMKGVDWVQAEADALKDVQAIPDARLRDATALRVNRQFAQAAQLRQQGQEQALTTLSQQFQKGGAAAVQQSLVSTLDFEHARSWAAYTAHDGKIPKTAKSEGTVISWLQDLSSADPNVREAAMAKPVSVLYGWVPWEQVEEIAAEQRRVSEGRGIDPDKEVSLKAVQYTLEDNGITALYNEGKGTTDPNNTLIREFTAEFRRAVEPENERRRAEKRAPLNAEEQRQIASKLLAKVVVKPGFLWNSTDYAFNAPGHEKSEWTYANIPLADRKKAAEELRAAGATVNEESVKRAIMEKRARGAAAASKQTEADALKAIQAQEDAYFGRADM